ncbi:MAG: hypothetical protein II087_06360, partial [Muribaculaceae bacterium]|nr:hypothetical protein [Muribaculaceae bacterium]
QFNQGTPNSEHPYATVSAVITDGSRYQDPEDQAYTNVVAKAANRQISVTGKDVEPNPKYVVYPLNLTANNVVTEITDVHSNREIVGDGYYYNLAGQRVTNPTPGFYIHNGKKVIVR